MVGSFGVRGGRWVGFWFALAAAVGCASEPDDLFSKTGRCAAGSSGMNCGVAGAGSGGIVGGAGGAAGKVEQGGRGPEGGSGAGGGSAGEAGTAGSSSRCGDGELDPG